MHTSYLSFHRRKANPLLLALSVATILGIGAFPRAAMAQEEALSEESAPDEVTEEIVEEPLWSGTTGLAYLATSGNSDTQNLGLTLELVRRPVPWGLELKALFDRAEENEVATAERYFARVRATRTLNERIELFAGLSAEQEELAGLDLRTLVELGGTYRSLQGPRHFLEFDLGLTWTDEDRVPPALDDSFLGAVLGLDYEWKIGETAAFSQRLTYFPNFDESEDWRAESESAITAAMTDRLALKVGYEVRYRNQPIEDRKDTDTSTKVSLIWKL